MSEAIAVETCHLCGMDLERGCYQTRFSDEWEVRNKSVVWLKKKYCSGDGTLKCAAIPTQERRGPMYEAWLEDPNIIPLKETGEA